MVKSPPPLSRFRIITNHYVYAYVFSMYKERIIYMVDAWYLFRHL